MWAWIRDHDLICFARQWTSPAGMDEKEIKHLLLPCREKRMHWNIQNKNRWLPATISDCTSMLRYIRGWINPYLSWWTTQSSAENLSHIAQSGPIQRILNMDPQHPCKDFLRYVKERNATWHLRCCIKGNAIGQLKRRQNPDVFWPNIPKTLTQVQVIPLGDLEPSDYGVP